MIYLIIKENLDRPRVNDRGVPDNGAHGWDHMHTERDAAIKAFMTIHLEPREIGTLVEIDAFSGTWNVMLLAHGQHALKEWFEAGPRHADNYDKEAEKAHAARVAEAKRKKLGLA